MKNVVEEIRAQIVVKQRKPDAGDWFKNIVRSLVCDDWRSCYAIIVHELIEKLICERQLGMTWEEVDQEADMVYDGTIKMHSAKHWGPHLKALAVEKAVCKALGLDWKQHTRNIEKALRHATPSRRKRSRVSPATVSRGA
jgi:hypothetical protein